MSGKIFPITTSGMLVCIAFLHRAQLDLSNPTTYTGSIYVPIEMFLVLMIIILFVRACYRATTALFAKSWRIFWTQTALAMILLGLFLLAIQIDAPTLIYMT